MHLEVLVGAVAKELRAARPEVGEPGDVLLGCQGGCLVEVDFSLRHCRSPFLLHAVTGEHRNRLSIRKPLKGNNEGTRIAPHSQQNDER
jgi:hypothetical protein